MRPRTRRNVLATVIALGNTACDPDRVPKGLEKQVIEQAWDYQPRSLTERVDRLELVVQLQSRLIEGRELYKCSSLDGGSSTAWMSTGFPGRSSLGPKDPAGHELCRAGAARRRRRSQESLRQPLGAGHADSGALLLTHRVGEAVPGRAARLSFQPQNPENGRGPTVKPLEMPIGVF